jgi:Putative peptidoglycan binding domain
MTARRVTLIAGAIAAGVAITAFAVESGGGPATATSLTGATATAAVARTTLASRQQVAGTLERARSYTPVSQQSPGTLTELPAAGTVIGRGQVLYRLDGQPVRLLYGTQSAWRTLAPGIADGADVRQLKQNLKALGFTAGVALTVDDDFDWATALAIERWQRADGLAQTGVLPLGSIAFLPGAVRVTAQRALPGSPAQPGTPVLDLSSTDLAVSVPLDPSLWAARARRRPSADPAPGGPDHTGTGQPDRRGRHRGDRANDLGRLRLAERRRRGTERKRPLDPGRIVGGGAGDGLARPSRATLAGSIRFRWRWRSLTPSAATCSPPRSRRCWRWQTVVTQWRSASGGAGT